MGQDKCGLIKQMQRLHEEANKNKIYSLLPMNRQCPATSHEVGLQSA